MTTATGWPNRMRVIGSLSQYAAVATMAFVLLLALVVAPSFYDPGNLRAVLLQTSSLGVIVLGQTVALLVRGLDMSVSAVAAVAGVVVVSATSGGEIVLHVLIAAGLAVAVGLANGLLVTWRRVPPFVATFAMLIVVAGARLAYTHGHTSGSVPRWLRQLGSGSVVGVPVSLLIWLGLAALLTVALTRTTWGRWIYAVGDSRDAARHGGVPVNLVVVSAYVVCAVLAAVGGLLLSGYLGYVDENLANDANINSIAAAIIGGVAFSGGRGTVWGAAVGAVLLTALINLVVVAGLPIYWQLIAGGLVLVFAVAIQGLRDRWAPDGA